MKLLKLKNVTVVEFLVVMVMFGFFVAAIIPNEIIGIKLKKTMPKTYEYVVTNRDFLSVRRVCKKNFRTDEMVSDEICYNKMMVFNNCKNEMKEGYASVEFSKLLHSVETKKQTDAIINKCKTYKKETSKNKISVKEFSKGDFHQNDAEIIDILNHL